MPRMAYGEEGGGGGATERKGERKRKIIRMRIGIREVINYR